MEEWNQVILWSLFSIACILFILTILKDDAQFNDPKGTSPIDVQAEQSIPYKCKKCLEMKNLNYDNNE